MIPFVAVIVLQSTVVQLPDTPFDGVNTPAELIRSVPPIFKETKSAIRPDDITSVVPIDTAPALSPNPELKYPA